MKIESSEPTRPFSANTTGASVNDVQGNPFKDILAQTIARSDQPEAIPTSVPPSGLSRIAIDRLPSLQKEVTTQSVSRYLDLLSDYQKQLADSRLSLRTIEPAIKRLHDQKADLQPLLDSLPADDPLKAIGQQGLILGSLETLRFYKGDYIAC